MRYRKTGFTETKSEVNFAFIRCEGWSKLAYDAVDL